MAAAQKLSFAGLNSGFLEAPQRAAHKLSPCNRRRDPQRNQSCRTNSDFIIRRPKTYFESHHLGAKSRTRSSPLSIDQQPSGSQLATSSAARSAGVKTGSQKMGSSAATTTPPAWELRAMHSIETVSNVRACAPTGAQLGSRKLMVGIAFVVETGFVEVVFAMELDPLGGGRRGSTPAAINACPHDRGNQH